MDKSLHLVALTKQLNKQGNKMNRISNRNGSTQLENMMLVALVGGLLSFAATIIYFIAIVGDYLSTH